MRGKSNPILSYDSRAAQRSAGDRTNESLSFPSVMGLSPPGTTASGAGVAGRGGDTAMNAAANAALAQAFEFVDGAMHDDGRWCGEMKSNVTITTEYIFLLQAIGLRDKLDQEALSRYIRSEQSDDGSWALAPGLPGDVSTTVEAYLALKLLGHTNCDCSAMDAAKKYILTVGGGVEKVRVFTRIFLATFGLFPWSSVPQLPPELILLPSWALINIYKLSSWARSTIVPLCVLCHHRPIYALPNGISPNNNFLDELWIDPENKSLPYGKLFGDMISRMDFVALTFSVMDRVLCCVDRLRYVSPLRKAALDQCMAWILSHQEASGDWAGILALYVEGYGLADSPLRPALEAMERFAWQDEHGKRIQACVSPVWDTVLMSISLADSKATVVNDKMRDRLNWLLDRGLEWIKARQILGDEGGWRVYRPRLSPGGFSFEYFNAWYPDIDDTAAVIIAGLKHDRNAVLSTHVVDAARWLLGKQSTDGGWAAFDVENDRLFLNKIPFSDMDSLCDPPTADVVGRVLEAFGLFMQTAHEIGAHGIEPLRSLLARIRKACHRGIRWLAHKQEVNGSWYGRWGVNYIYGTSNVLCGLAYFCFPDEAGMVEDSTGLESSDSTIVELMVRPALSFLLAVQQTDGGWGKLIGTYQYPSNIPRDGLEFRKCFSDASTPSQTAWAIMALSTYLSTNEPAIQSGIRWLVENQTVRVAIDRAHVAANRSASKGSTAEGDSPQQKPAESVAECLLAEKFDGLTWPRDLYTGTGFPNHFYLRYTFYSHYFPMMALARYLATSEQDKLGARSYVVLG